MEYKLLITGSRQASTAMLYCAFKAVLRARELGWGIIVGDAPGVDAKVIQTCNTYNVPYRCYGITRCGRQSFIKRDSYIQVQTNNYPERDRTMVNALPMGGICFAIWDGRSPGTKLTFKAAQSREHLTVYVRNFGGERDHTY